MSSPRRSIRGMSRGRGRGSRGRGSRGRGSRGRGSRGRGRGGYVVYRPRSPTLAQIRARTVGTLPRSRPRSPRMESRGMPSSLSQVSGWGPRADIAAEFPLPLRFSQLPHFRMSPLRKRRSKSRSKSGSKSGSPKPLRFDELSHFKMSPSLSRRLHKRHTY